VRRVGGWGLALALAFVVITGWGSLAEAATPTKAVSASQSPAAVMVALVSLADDPRYQPRRLEHAYPGQPAGRLSAGAALGLADADVALQDAGQAVRLKEITVADMTALPAALAQLKAERVSYWLLDLPASAVRMAVEAARDAAVLFNLSASQDALRASECSAQLFHTIPSQAMLQDAQAQYLAARSWRNALVLQGPSAEDALLQQAWKRSAARYGVKAVDTRGFKLSGDPRERDLANPLLLTAQASYDVVAVLDADGEFARTLPYATQLPRPVVGSNGLVALAWHPQWERYGAPQVSRRFYKSAARPMTGNDWSAWIAARTVAALVAEQPKASPAQQAQALRSGQVSVDGSKGVRLTYRAWDGQLRQPVLLAHGEGVVAVAPLDGVLHPTEQLDTLGVDQQESACRARR